MELSPRQYLECLEDQRLRKYIKKGMHFFSDPTHGWKKPRAIRSNLGLNKENWEIHKTWAQLLVQPSLVDRFAYYRISLALIVGSLFYLAMAYCVLTTAPTVSHLGGSYGQGAIMAASCIILGWLIEKLRSFSEEEDLAGFLDFVMVVISSLIILIISIIGANSIDLTVGSLMEIYHPTLALGNLGINPIPDFITVLTLSPLMSILLVPIFWQMNRIMTNARSRWSEERGEFYGHITNMSLTPRDNSVRRRAKQQRKPRRR